MFIKLKVTSSIELMSQRFCHLRVRSEYSILSSVLTVENIQEYVKEQKSLAIGLVDNMSLSGTLNFSQSLKSSKVKPVIGLNVFIGKEDEAESDYLPYIGLLAKNKDGYQALLKFLYNAHSKNRKNNVGQLYVTIEDLEQIDTNNNIICLTGGYNGLLADTLKGSNVNANSSNETLDKLINIFNKNNIYIELTRHGRENEQQIENALITLAYQYNLPLVATNDVYFYQKKHFDAHDALTCIKDKTFIFDKERKKLNHEYYLKSEEEMIELFSDIPEAIDNTINIAKRCSFFVEKRQPTLPSFNKTNEEDETELQEIAIKGLKNHLSRINFDKSNYSEKDYLDRLEFELNVIRKMKFCGYFLLVADFINWAKTNGIAVGPGRGSGAGSVVAWSVGITSVDPLKYGLLFERFLNPDRVSMPDFDIDFCQERRQEVIDYVTQKYGKERIGNIITYGKLQAKAVLKDVGRVMQIPYLKIDSISKLIPFNPLEPITLTKAIEMDPKFKEEIARDSDIKELIDISLDIEGLFRHTSTHAAGIIIADKPIIELAPVYIDQETGNSIIGYDMKDTEKIGFVKFDFLGLKTLTVVAKTVEMIKQNHNIEIDIDSIPLNDKKTFDLLQSSKLKGIFQLEAAVPRNALKKIKTDRFEDIVAITSLNRPGPMENIPSYIRRKNGEEQINYYYDCLKELLRETYGIIIYQEQVMEIAKILAGYSLAEADLLRRAMGKKIKEEMDKQCEIFVSKSIERGTINKSEADAMFKILEKFSGYGFNKSHAVAYSVISYQTAYLKANYPMEFFTAMLNLDVDNTDKLNEFIADLKTFNINIVPPSINISDALFKVYNGSIAYGLSAIKGIGSGAAEYIVNQRTATKIFNKFEDFLSSCKDIINKKVIENLAKSGALECTGYTRKTIVENINEILRYTTDLKTEESSQVINLFGEANNDKLNMKQHEEYSLFDKLQTEFEAVGFYLTKHPIESFAKTLEESNVIQSSDLDMIILAEQDVIMCGVITKVTQRFRNNSRFAFVHLSDIGGMYEIMIFKDDIIVSNKELLKEGKSIVAVVKVKNHPDSGRKITVSELYSIESFVSQKDILIPQISKKYNIFTQEELSIIERISNPVHDTKISISISSQHDISNIKEDINNGKYSKYQFIELITEQGKVVISL